MNKTWIIIKREYLTRVKAKSFIIMTLLMPVFMALVMFVPTYLAIRDTKDTKVVAVSDHSLLVKDQLKGNNVVRFEYITPDEEDNAKQKVKNDKYHALLIVPEDIETSNNVGVYSYNQVNIEVKSTINNKIKSIISNHRLKKIYAEANIPNLDKRIADAKAKISVNTYKIIEDDSNNAEESSTEAAMVVGYAMGFIIYGFIFIYGSMVMRGVVEEKQNRIVEVIISSVKPSQLMLGKIIGLAGVGLTQVVIWITMTLAIGSSLPANDVLSAAMSIDIGPILIGFIIYFMLGYLLYSSLMAAVAAAVDSQEDMQQFILPVSAPLVIAIVLLMSVTKNPDGALAIWTSHIPFLSPIIMMARIPFGVAWWEIAISIVTLALSSCGCIWVAAKVYRTGILMYGKKPSWKEIGKWIKYRN